MHMMVYTVLKGFYNMIYTEYMCNSYAYFLLINPSTMADIFFNR